MGEGVVIGGGIRPPRGRLPVVVVQVAGPWQIEMRDGCHLQDVVQTHPHPEKGGGGELAVEEVIGVPDLGLALRLGAEVDVIDCSTSSSNKFYTL